MPSLKPDGSAQLQKTLDDLAEEIPGCFLTVATADDILFDGCSGHFDMLEKSDSFRRVTTDDVMWFASTTKLLTAVCYLQLIDRGMIGMDTVLGEKFPALAHASKHVLESFDADGKPIFVESTTPITVRMMLNQTSGFGMEFGQKVQQWKKVTDKGQGFVNSCKIENLIHTPICNQPGEVFEYGNSAEWLGLILPTLVGISTEEYLQDNVLRPLGMDSTTFYPFGPRFDDRLLPVRYAQVSETDSTGRENKLAPTVELKWEALDGQLDLLTLPRIRKDIEYPVAGGGIYSKTSDYVLLLQYLLRHKLSLDQPSKTCSPRVKILSDSAIHSLFSPTLPESAYESLLSMYNPYLALTSAENMLKPGDADWSTAMAIYNPKSGRRLCGWGRLPGSVGWGGAAGTEYFIDKESGIAVAFTTQMLPGSLTVVKEAKKRIEMAIYNALQD